MKKIIILFMVSLMLVNRSSAQQCSYFPADCPDAFIEATRDSEGCLRNWIIPQEIAMQSRLRNYITSLMEEIGKKKNWEVYEFTELTGGGIGIDDNTKPLPYQYRRPYQYTISFDFIVNKDSLEAWQHWYQTELLQRSNDVVNSYKQTDNNSEQPFADSVMRYAGVMGKYLSDHAEEYQKAILNNDSKYIKKHDDDVQRIQDKIDKFTNKANGERDKNFSSSDNKSEDLQAYRKRNMIAYRNASILRVSFIFNQDLTSPLDENIKLTRTLSVPNASFGASFHNSNPDLNFLPFSFLTNPDFTFLLFGKWITKPNHYGSYEAIYHQDRKNIDGVTVKTIPCDKVQTVFIGIEGQPKYSNEFVQVFDLQKLKSNLLNQ